MNVLCRLQDLFNKSGINGHPVITDGELKTLERELREISDYMKYRGDSSMSSTLRAEADQVLNVIQTRERFHYRNPMSGVYQ